MTLNYGGTIMRTSKIGKKERKKRGAKKVINQFRKFKLKLARTATKRVDQKQKEFLLG